MLFSRHCLVAVVAAWAISLTASAQQVRYLEGHTDPIYAVAYSPDGKLLVTGSFDKTVKLWIAPAASCSARCLTIPTWC